MDEADFAGQLLVMSDEELLQSTSTLPEHEHPKFVTGPSRKPLLLHSWCNRIDCILPALQTGNQGNSLSVFLGRAHCKVQCNSGVNSMVDGML